MQQAQPGTTVCDGYLHKNLELAGMTPRALYTLKEVATLTGTSVETLYQWHRDKRIRTVKLGWSVRVPAVELARILFEGVAA